MQGEVGSSGVNGDITRNLLRENPDLIPRAMKDSKMSKFVRFTAHLKPTKQKALKKRESEREIVTSKKKRKKIEAWWKRWVVALVGNGIPFTSSPHGCREKLFLFGRHNPQNLSGWSSFPCQSAAESAALTTTITRSPFWRSLSLSLSLRLHQRVEQGLGNVLA